MFIDAEKMTEVQYMVQEPKVAGKLDLPEDIAWMAEQASNLVLTPAEFKISEDDMARAGLLRFSNLNDDTVTNINIFFLPGGRVLVVKKRIPYLYTADYGAFLQRCSEYVLEANKKYQKICCGIDFWINIPPEWKAE